MEYMTLLPALDGFDASAEVSTIHTDEAAVETNTYFPSGVSAISLPATPISNPSPLVTRAGD